MSHEIIIPGRFDRITEVCAFVAAGAEQSGFDNDEIFRIELACDEACTNIIEHAYSGDFSGDIRVQWRLSGNQFIVTMFDNGQSFDPGDVPEPTVPADPNKLDDLKIGGLGVHFMRKLMDEISYSFNQSGENKLVMVKYLPAGDEQ